MISINQVGDIYEVRFKYDSELVNLIKEVPTREWHPERKCWDIHKDKLGFFLAKLKDTPWEHETQIKSYEELDKNYTIDYSKEVPNVDISDVDLYVQDGSKLFQHQIDAIKYDKWRNEHGIRSGFLLADAPGLAKTCSVMNIAMYHKKKYGAKHCLVIVCVNGAKFNWQADILKHSNGKINPYILGTRKKRDGSFRCDDGKAKVEDLMNMTMYGDKNGEPLPYFIITNIESLRTKLGRTYILNRRLIELVKAGEIGIIAVDEIHTGASPTSKQGGLLLDIKKACPPTVEWIPMTGTPITSKPTDLYTPLFLVGAHNSTSYYMWEASYCIKGGYHDKEIIGYKNIVQLKRILQPNMLKRNKDEVLDLPPKIYHTEYIENTPYQQRLYNNVKTQLRERYRLLDKRFNPMIEFIRLRQVNGSPELVDNINLDEKYLSKNAKLVRLLEILDEVVQDDEKALVFSNWVEPLRTIYKYLIKKYKVCCCTGTMSLEDREKHKEVFMRNPEYKIMIGTVGAMGTSHTLTAARNVIFYDSPWSPAQIEQCEDRCHRPGTTQTVNVYTLITKDTVDETVHEILSKKQGTAEFIVDDKLNLTKHPEFIELMLK